MGVFIFIATTWLFGRIAKGVSSGDSITVIDVHLAQWLHAHSAPWLTLAMQMISMLHDVLAISIMTIVFAAILVVKRYWYWLLNLILVVPGGLLPALIVSKTVSWNRRVWTVLLAFSIVSLVAFSRLYLGAHYLSDVLAALAEGLAWLALCLTATHAYDQKNGKQIDRVTS